ncbi:hypothetical protein [Prosthecobacter sp.]|uniref:hypothetical protein n=1 Tax=Prosthecobacter sp. TaxID=1965333 RepID=UPI003783CE9E
MKFNPHTQELFTEEGRLLKRLHCPFRLDWSKLGPTDDPADRRCGICQHTVTDTAQRTEAEVVALLQGNPQACLQVDLSQKNLTLTYQTTRP